MPVGVVWRGGCCQCRDTPTRLPVLLTDNGKAVEAGSTDNHVSTKGGNDGAKGAQCDMEGLNGSQRSQQPQRPEHKDNHHHHHCYCKSLPPVCCNYVPQKVYVVCCMLRGAMTNSDDSNDSSSCCLRPLAACKRTVCHMLWQDLPMTIKSRTLKRSLTNTTMPKPYNLSAISRIKRYSNTWDSQRTSAIVC